MSSQFKVKDVQRLNQGIFISLLNNINQGETESANYFCSLVYKAGRTLTIFSSPRIIILIKWKKRPFTIGYLQELTALPPWGHIPVLKYQKQLSVISLIERKETNLLFYLKDQEKPWQMIFKSEALAAEWRRLINDNIREQRQRSNAELEAVNIKELAEVRGLPGKAINNQLIIEGVVKKNQEVEDDSLILTMCENQGSSTDIQKVEQKSEEVLRKREDSIYSLVTKMNQQNGQWIERERLYEERIKTLQNQNQSLKVENEKFQLTVQELKEESARLKLGKIVLTAFKEEYAKKHDQMRVELFKRTLEEKKIMQVCADLLAERKEQQSIIEDLRRQLAAATGAPFSPELTSDHLLERLSTLAEDTTSNVNQSLDFPSSSQ